ncbi:MAG: class I SAM-dependent methyltransferase [Candidatus Latescibacterota bacterium]|nr:MAG: class I SAM-dependent methyltransferase [Candidatus Latescibacterota bacterium]
MENEKYPNMVYDDRMWDLIRSKLGENIERVLELGSRYGHWVEGLLENFTIDRIYCIDFWKKCRWRWAKEWFERLEPHVFETVFPLRGQSHEWAEIRLLGDFDLLYVDANHKSEEVFRDLKCWYPRVRSGGLIICHDCHATKVLNPVMKFFRNLRREITDRPTLFDSGPDHEKSCWIVKR